MKPVQLSILCLYCNIVFGLPLLLDGLGFGRLAQIFGEKPLTEKAPIEAIFSEKSPATKEEFLKRVPDGVWNPLDFQVKLLLWPP
jgi:hypothetical protein